MKKKIISLILAIVTAFSVFAISTVPASADLSLKTNSTLDYDSAVALINAYSDSKFEYEIESEMQLKSVANNEDTYTLFILKPCGYAIFYNNGTTMVEACYEENSFEGLEIDSDKEYYYAGPSTFAEEKNSQLVLSDGYMQLDTEDIQYVAEFENRLAESYESYSTYSAQNTAIPESNKTVSKDVALSYFSNLKSFGSNDDYGCVIVATAILIGYYYHNVNKAYMDSKYATSATSSSSAGTTAAFCQYLNDNYITTISSGGTNFFFAGPGINKYLSSRGLSSYFSYTMASVTNTQSKIVSVISNSKPAIAGMKKSNGADYDHAVIVYGYKYTYTTSDEVMSVTPTDSPNYNPDTLMYRIHYGWKKTDHYNKIVTSKWFDTCGYFTD